MTVLWFNNALCVCDDKNTKSFEGDDSNMDPRLRVEKKTLDFRGRLERQHLGGYLGRIWVVVKSMVPFWESILNWGYKCRCRCGYRFIIWVVVKIMVPFWVLSIIRHLVFRGPRSGS